VPNIDPLYILLWFIVFLFSLSVHESAHAYVSDLFGDDTGKVLGRISLNPIVHIDPFGTILFPLLGMFGAHAFGWAKPVPVNPLNWREKDKANFWVSAAGPLSNLALAIVFFAITKAFLMSGFGPQLFGEMGKGTIWDPIGTILETGIQLNVILMVFNLLPIPPLDGSGVLESILPYEAQQGFEQLKPYGFLLLIALLLSGVLGYILRPVLNFVYYLLLL
jgi:Zn-dependent protease